MADNTENKETGAGALDHSSRSEFFDYYADQSASPEARARFERLRDIILRIRRDVSPTEKRTFDVLDVGCGAGTLSVLWAEAGHRVIGIDVNAPLIELARKRGAESSRTVDFRVGTATALPLEDESIDICMVPELLEHVAEWEKCLDEFTRVLRPGGLLYLTTTNRLCPRQQEFNLPLYSWYPGFLKRRFEAMAVGKYPGLANHATYPAVNWFTVGQLRSEFRRRGCATVLDRFDISSFDDKGPLRNRIIAFIRWFAPARMAAQFLNSGSSVLGIKA